MTLEQAYKILTEHTRQYVGMYDSEALEVAIKVMESHMPKEPQSTVECVHCKHLVFSDMYGECAKGYLGVVSPWDSCGYGELKDRSDKR